MPRVLLGCPTHDGRVHDGCGRALYGSASRQHQVESLVMQFSLLTTNCNILWAMALNRFEAGQLEWFALLHSDVQPEPHWIDKLIAAADEHQADVMTAVIPIKNHKGLTSTAIGDPADEYGKFVRLTMSQVRHPQFPKSFDAQQAVAALGQLPEGLRYQAAEPANLLCNTGAMVCRLGKWCDPTRVYFDEVTRFARLNGQWTPIVRSEDWFFTARAAACGAKVMATTTLQTIHHGTLQFPSDQVWGMPQDVEGIAQWQALG